MGRPQTGHGLKPLALNEDIPNGGIIPSGQTIQPMTASDIDIVLEIEQKSFPKPWTRGMFESELRNPLSSAYTIKVSAASVEGVLPPSRVVAYIVYWMVHGEAHIMNIAVDPSIRRRGLAKALLEVSLKRMRDNLIYEVFLEVRVSNEAARGLYKSFGFKESFERAGYYGDEDAIVMTLEM